MRNLLHANLVRLKKDRAFWLCDAIMVLITVGVCVNQYSYQINYNAHVVFDKLFLSYAMLTGFALAVFTSLFIGAEYSDGTIRNKVIVGHTRSEIYLANFLSCAAAGLLLDLIFVTVISCVGVPMFGFFQKELSLVLLLAIDGLLLTIVYAALFAMLSMLISNKAVNSIICLLLVFCGTLAAAILYSRLQEPEFITGMVMTVNGVSTGETWPNPLYLPPHIQAVCHVILDLLPSGQSIRIPGMTAPAPVRAAVFSVLETALFTGIGLAVFRKKDLK